MFELCGKKCIFLLEMANIVLSLRISKILVVKIAQLFTHKLLMQSCVNKWITTEIFRENDAVLTEICVSPL